MFDPAPGAFGVTELRAAYARVTAAAAVDIRAARTGDAILYLAVESLTFLLRDCELVPLVSRVAGKRYVSFRNGGAVARAANADLLLLDPDRVRALWDAWQQEATDEEDFKRLSYTVALAPCLAMEIFDRQNKKGPATYFECYIGHLFARAIGTNPARRARLPVADREVLLTMDFIFDIGPEHPKVHVPVKMSTRERVVQAWAHQRLLEAAYGPGAYRGVMVLFAETKLDSRNLEVVEICVPDQWLAYQSLLARMDRIYYFDVPAPYQALTDRYPDLIGIRQFGAFFTEIELVLRG